MDFEANMKEMKTLEPFKNQMEDTSNFKLFHNGDSYLGEFKNGVPDGRGKYTFSTGETYTG